MVLQELLFPNYDTCAHYDMYFRFKWMNFINVLDDMDNLKNEVRMESQLRRQGYYDPDAHEVHVSGWQALHFDTYFNCFAIGKWRKYTRLDNLKLRLDLKGSFHVSLLHMYFMNAEPFENAFCEKVCRAEERTTFEFDIPCEAWDRGMIGFRLSSLGEADNVCYGGGYITEVDEETLNPVDIAIDICTFKREQFVERNIRLLNKGIIENPESPAHGHLDVFISDNGKTLDVEALNSERVHVFPNKNVGGAGGFARGMMEILDYSRIHPVSHVLVMDDDVLISTDAIVRTYRLLQFMKPEYAGKTVAGAMLRLDNRHVQQECGGWWDGFYVHSCKTFLDLTDIESMLRNENEDEPNYNAWWYSCIPITKISNENLPMPIFIRYDDVEYGLRTGGDIIAMSGICLWHEPFEYKYSSGLEYYQMRNALIVNALHRPGFDAKAAVRFLRNSVKHNIGRYRYRNCELLFRAVEDFCKGPEFLLTTDGEALHKDVLASGERFKPLTELNAQFDEGEYLRSLKRERLYKRAIRLVTLNKNLKPKSGSTVIDASLNGVKDIAGKKTVLNYDVSGNRGFVTEYSFSKTIATLRRAWQMCRLLKQKHGLASEAYRQARPILTSREFWDGYLGLK